MPFETITIRDAMRHIQQRNYLLPGIQREFVWRPEQICQLFDSLLRGYPIGSFLFWQVGEEHKADYKFYEFLRDYHEQEGRHNPKVSVLPAGGLTAVLDGQQRLTSLYIGLLGSHTERRKYARRTSSSYAKRRLYLNLARPAEGDDGRFDFQFLESEQDFLREDDDFWFRVGKILSFKKTTDVFDLLVEHGLVQKQNLYPKTCLVELHRAVTELLLINYYTEVEQDLNRVLNIFIRMNSSGTPLSYSDLLLSIASAQWEERDARETVHALVDEINGEFGRFEFPRDFVLKCCLMLADVDLRWKVGNFNKANMEKIESLWPRIEEAIRLAVITVEGFGFTGKTLASTNAVIPIVYYLFMRGSPKGYADSEVFRNDREVMRRWLNVVLLKRTFGGVPDNVLRPMRDVIRTKHDSFPADDIREALEGTPAALAFQKGELEALLDQQYGGLYTFPLLAMLYPSLDFRNKFHQDHMHPKSHFTPTQLAKHGIPLELHAQYIDSVNRVANLQLLEGQPNIEKSAIRFADWLKATYPDPSRRADYLNRHHVAGSEFGLDGFIGFYAKRRERMLEALRQLVGEESATVDDADDLEAVEEVANFHAEVASAVGKRLRVELSESSQTCFSSTNDEDHIVCAVSKRYKRGSHDRYWYAIKPKQVEYLTNAKRAYVALGCGGPDLVVLIPAEKFVPALDGMRQTETEAGRRYWHVELFGNREHLELVQSLRNQRINVTEYVLSRPGDPERQPRQC